jgi:dTDP-4-dehydrorhamnose reductase
MTKPGMKILITGAGGFVGAAIAQRWAAKHSTLALHRQALDITDRAAVRETVHSQKPDLIINCAVLGVDACELDPARAQAVNVDGPQNLAEASVEVDAEILHFSTNYVFAGDDEDGKIYTAADAARPVNVYGVTKLAGERAVQIAAARSYIVRTSWVFGASAKNFLSTAPQQLRARQRVRAITDSWASATYVNDLLSRVEELLARQRYGVYHVVNEGVCSYYEFALEAARLVGLTATETTELIEQTTEAAVQRPAPRPRSTPMSCLLSVEIGLPPLRSWQEALRAYINRA